MKKIVKRIILLFVVILIIQLILFIVKKEHDINYELKSNNLVYKIHEVFKNNNYYYEIKVKNNYFVFDIENNYNKKKKVLKDIYYYENNNLSCIFPGINNEDIICTKDNNLQSYYESKKETIDFINLLKKKGYSNPNWNKNEQTIKKIGQVDVNTSNIKEDIYIYVWKYNGFYSINKKSLEQVNVFNNDTYVNDLGILVDKYYLIPNYDEKYDFNTMYVYNVTNNKKKEIKLKDSISRDSYINGIIDNKVYLMDKDNLIQYKIDPKKKKVQEVGNTKDNALYYDKGFKRINIYEYRKNKIYFKKNYDIEKITSVKDISYSNEVGDIYYYMKDNKFYKYNSIFKTNELLFTKKISNVYMIDDNIYFINDNKLYLYDGVIKEILTYDELSFNSTNRYIVYKK